MGDGEAFLAKLRMGSPEWTRRGGRLDRCQELFALEIEPFLGDASGAIRIFGAAAFAVPVA